MHLPKFCSTFVSSPDVLLYPSSHFMLQRRFHHYVLYRRSLHVSPFLAYYIAIFYFHFAFFFTAGQSLCGGSLLFVHFSCPSHFRSFFKVVFPASLRSYVHPFLCFFCLYYDVRYLSCSKRRCSHCRSHLSQLTPFSSHRPYFSHFRWPLRFQNHDK